MWGNYIWELILQIFTSFNRFFFPDGQGSPIEGIMVVSSLHLIGYLSSKALSMKPTFNWVSKILLFVFLGSMTISSDVE
jgi:hypothetical protein